MMFPIITFPYVSRVLGVTNLGKYNFSYSVVSYFLLIAALGINTYAIREGAKYRDNKRLLNEFASQVFSINVVSTILAYLLLLLTVITFGELHSYSVCIAVFSIQIIFTTIGTEWIYSIYENYAYITWRSILFKIISIILLFLFVHKSSDYIIYAGITVFASVGSNVWNFIYARTFTHIVFTFRMKIREHIKPIFVIFASSIAIMIYVNSDVTILGIMKDAYVVGIYSVSAKIYTILKTILSAALIVTVPRLSLFYGQKRFKEFTETASSVFNLLVLLVFPAVVGLIFISRNVVLLISGVNFVRATSSLQLLSMAAIFSIFAWFYSDCILIPAKMENIVLISTIISAVVNLVLNFLLIPYFSENASAFATIIAEMVNMFITIKYGRNIVTINGFKRNLYSVIFASIFVAISCYIVNLLSLIPFWSIVVSVILSSITYFGVLIICKNKLVITYINERIFRNK
ncbi:EpsN [Limosilactobacillus gastricus DSM 16045]|uniref:EpsN n=2 Tax=Limosilactobacillus gastricus TaxID=227942 RepID=A0A0R1V4F1_9LACO|nr:EpsN [Limosilactobacillus gastricus DSM 16045]